MAHIFDYSASSSSVDLQIDRMLAGTDNSSFHGFLGMQEFWNTGTSIWSSTWYSSEADRGVVRSDYAVIYGGTSIASRLRERGDIVDINDLDAVPDAVEGYDTDRLVFFDLHSDTPDAGGVFIIDGVQAVTLSEDSIPLNYMNRTAAGNANASDFLDAQALANADFESRLTTPVSDIDSIRVIRWSDGDVNTPDLDLIYTPDKDTINTTHDLADMFARTRLDNDMTRYYSIGIGDYGSFRGGPGFKPYIGTETEITLTDQNDTLDSGLTMGDVARTVRAGGGDDRISLLAEGIDEYRTLYSDLIPESVAIYGEAGNDTIIANVNPEGSMLIDGGTGNDRVTIGRTSEVFESTVNATITIRGGDGNDDIFIYKSSGVTALVEGGSGDDRLYDSGANNTTFFAGDGDDFFSDGSGGNEGSHVVHVGNGFDKIIVRGINDVVHAGEGGGEYIAYGDASVVFADAVSGVTVDLARNEQFTGGYAISAHIKGFDHATGTGFSDDISGTHQANTLLGAGGDDMLFGRGGDDDITGGAGADAIDGGEGMDTAHYDGAFSDYTVTRVTLTSFTVTGQGDGGDTIVDIERLAFSDRIVTLSTNDPVASAGSLTGDENSVLSGILTATDADGDTLTFSKASGPTNGTATVAANGAITYTPDADFNGTDSFTYIVTDGEGGEASETVSITVVPVDDATVPGTSSDDILIGRAGNDFIDGGAGDDMLIGSPSADLADSAGAQVYRIYQATLDRAPDTGGFEGWIDRLESGARSVRDVVSGFVGSGEFQTVYGNLSNRDFVTLLYNNVLDRAPDEGGLNAWLDRLSNGTDREDVVVGFSESGEFKGNTGIAASAYTGALDGRAQSAAMDDVFRLYQATLDRAPDAAGLDTWSSRLADGTAFTTIVGGFTRSAEFTNTYGTLEDGAFINQLYLNVLDREADAGGLAGWQAVIDDGGTREDVVRGFAQSGEFINKTAADFEVYMKAPGGDRFDGGSGNDTLHGDATADIFIFDADEDGTDVVLQLDTWDTLRFESFGYSGAEAALAMMTAVGSDVRFGDQGVEIVFAGADLQTLQEVDYLFA